MLQRITQIFSPNNFCRYKFGLPLFTDCNLFLSCLSRISNTPKTRIARIIFIFLIQHLPYEYVWAVHRMYAQSTLTDVTRCSKNPLVVCLRVFRPEPKEEKRKGGFIQQPAYAILAGGQGDGVPAHNVGHQKWQSEHGNARMWPPGRDRHQDVTAKMS